MFPQITLNRYTYRRAVFATIFVILYSKRIIKIDSAGYKKMNFCIFNKNIHKIEKSGNMNGMDILGNCTCLIQLKSV